jgi:GxxExxY protein
LGITYDSLSGTAKAPSTPRKSLGDLGALAVKKKQVTKPDIEAIGKEIVDRAIRVHRTLGPGLLESAYQKCLQYELIQAGLQAETEVNMPIQYGEVLIDVGYRLDMWVEKMVIVENKTVDKLMPIHQAQLLTYLKLTGCKLGFLLNWNVPLMRDGIRRMVNNL